MRFDNFVNEGINVKQYLPHIKKKCGQAIKAMISAQRGMWRGVSSPRFDDLIRRKVRQDRKPKDTWPEYSEFLDNELKQKFGWKPRKQGLFVSGDIHQSGKYGDVYLIFPVGDFKYVWNPEVKDMINILGSTHKLKANPGLIEPSIEREVDNNFTDKDIKRALKSGNELMIKCNEYFGLHIDWIERSGNYDLMEEEFGSFFRVQEWGY